MKYNIVICQTQEVVYYGRFFDVEVADEKEAREKAGILATFYGRDADITLMYKEHPWLTDLEASVDWKNADIRNTDAEVVEVKKAEVEARPAYVGSSQVAIRGSKAS